MKTAIGLSDPIRYAQFCERYSELVKKEAVDCGSDPELSELIVQKVFIDARKRYGERAVPENCNAYLLAQTCIVYAHYSENPDVLRNVLNRISEEEKQHSLQIDNVEPVVGEERISTLDDADSNTVDENDVITEAVIDKKVECDMMNQEHQMDAARNTVTERTSISEEKAFSETNDSETLAQSAARGTKNDSLTNGADESEYVNGFTQNQTSINDETTKQNTNRSVGISTNRIPTNCYVYPVYSGYANGNANTLNNQVPRYSGYRGYTGIQHNGGSRYTGNRVNPSATNTGPNSYGYSTYTAQAQYGAGGYSGIRSNQYQQPMQRGYSYPNPNMNAAFRPWNIPANTGIIDNGSKPSVTPNPVKEIQNSVLQDEIKVTESTIAENTVPKAENSADTPVVAAPVIMADKYNPDKTSLWVPDKTNPGVVVEAMPPERGTAQALAFEPEDEEEERSVKLSVVNTILFLCVLASIVFVIWEIGLF